MSGFNPEGAARFEKAFARGGPVASAAGAAGPDAKLGPAFQSAAHVYAAVYVAAMERCGAAPAAREEANVAACAFLDMLAVWGPAS